MLFAILGIFQDKNEGTSITNDSRIQEEPYELDSSLSLFALSRPKKNFVIKPSMLIDD
jgi:hypothetical protein